MSSVTEALKLLGKGPARPTLYTVRVGNMVNNPARTNEVLNLFCSGASVPSFGYNTAMALGHEYMGITREMPTTAVYGKPLILEVIDNTDMEMYKNFRFWMDRISTNANQPGIGGNTPNGRSQRMRYYDEYVQDVEVIKLEYAGENYPDSDKVDKIYRPTLEVKFASAYPVEIGAIDLRSDSVDSVLTFNVSLTYESYHIKNSQGVSSGGVVRGLW